MQSMTARKTIDDFTPAVASEQRRTAFYATQEAIREQRELQKAIEDAKRGDATSWVSMFANMIISGSPIEQCALRLKKPRVLLEQVMNEPWFKTLMDQLAAESKDNVGMALLKGSTVDNIYCLLQLRNSPGTRPETKAKICMYLLDRTEGIPKAGHGGQLAKTGLYSFGNGIEDGVDREIARHLAAHPELLRRPKGAVGDSEMESLNSADAPETEREVRGGLPPPVKQLGGVASVP